MKVEHKVGLDRNAMSMIRWTYGLTTERKKNAKFGELFRLKPVTLVVDDRDRLKWFGILNDVDWVK